MIYTTKELIQAYKDLECMFAVVIGIITQIFHTNVKTVSNYFTIAISSIFIALTIVPFVLEYFEIVNGSTTAIVVYSLSSLISVKIIILLDNNLLDVIKRLISRILK